MARTRTLAQLRSDVCDRADVVDGGTTGRHTSTRLNRYINQAIQRYITMVTGAGGQDFYAKRGGVLSMGTSTTKDAAGWAPNMYIPMPADFFELIGIDIIVGSTVLPMLQFERIERNVFRDIPFWLSANGLGMPVYYRMMGANAAGTVIAEVIPWSDGGAYSYEVWYVPVVADLANDSDTFDGRAGFEEYVVFRAALDVLLNDGNTNTPLYASIKLDCDDIEKRVNHKFGTMAGPGRRIDTESLRQRLGWGARGDWRSI